MSRSSQSSRSTSSYFGKIPLSCQTDFKKRITYDPASYDSHYLDPRYIISLSDARSFGSFSDSSSSIFGRSSKSAKFQPLSISHGSSSRDDGRSKTKDSRYYTASFLDDRKPEKKPLSCQTKDRDERYYKIRLITDSRGPRRRRRLIVNAGIDVIYVA